MQERYCWTLTTGEAGMTSQVVGLAEAIGIPFTHYTIQLRAPWRWLPGNFCPGVLRFGLAAGSSHLTPPWPDLLISSGRRSVAAAISIKQLSEGKTLTVHIQDPQISPDYFDWVVPPRHDGLAGPNVWPTRGALHRVTVEKLADAAQMQANRFVHLPRPLVGVLIGGATRHAAASTALATALGAELAHWSQVHGVGIAITPSRRTGLDLIRSMQQTLEDTPHFFWDGSGENPYFAILALADVLVVTGDSVSMVSEAAATGKPLYIADLGRYGKRLTRFHQQLRHEGVTRSFPSELAYWNYNPINDTPIIAQRIRDALF